MTASGIHRRNARTLAALAAAALLLIAPIAAVGAPPEPPPDPPAPPASVLPEYEKLTYRVMVWKGIEALGAEVGTGSFELKKRTVGGRDIFFIEGEGKGGALGFDIDTSLKSRIARDGLAPLGYDYEQDGSKHKVYKLDFVGGRVIYRKMAKHCNWPDCDDEAHIITRTERAFWIGPKRTITEHCEDHDDCRDMEHHRWLVRDDREVEPGTYDVLSAVYIARTLGLKENGEKKVIRVTSRHDTWNVRVTPHQIEKVELPGGEREALLLTLEPEAAEGSDGVREEFRGLFGLHGALRIWVDTDSYVPVKVLGVIPFGVNLNAQIELTDEEHER